MKKEILEIKKRTTKRYNLKLKGGKA